MSDITEKIKVSEINFYIEEVEEIVKRLESDQKYKIKCMKDQLKFLRTFRETYNTNIRQHEIMLVLVQLYYWKQHQESVQAFAASLEDD